MFMSSNTRIHHPVSIYTKSFSYIYSLLNLLCKFGTHLSCFAFKGPFEFEFSRSSVAAAEALLSFPRRDSSCREHISHHFCEQPGFQFQTELFKSLTLQQLVTKGDSCSNTRMVPAGTETGAQVFGCVMEQGGEKENNHARTASLASPHQRKFLQGLVQCLVHKQGKAHSAHPQACRSAFANSSTGPGATKELQALAPLASFLSGCSHDLTLTPAHLGKAVPRSQKNTPRKRHPALEQLKGSEPAQPGVFRADKGTNKARNSPFPCSLTLGLSRNTTKKYFIVKDFKVQLLKCSAC